LAGGPSSVFSSAALPFLKQFWQHHGKAWCASDDRLAVSIDRLALLSARIWNRLNASFYPVPKNPEKMKLIVKRYMVKLKKYTLTESI
jgi:hypothetical protein